MADPVLTKTDFVRRYLLGEFGNTAREWPDLQSYLASRHSWCDIHLRNRVTGGPTWYGVRPWAVETTCLYLACEELVRTSDLYFAEMGPGDEHRTLNGEVRRGLWGLDLHCSLAKLPMRDALRESPLDLCGASALWLLREKLDLDSLDWLDHLLASYPDHVVEFTSWDREWGTVVGFNTTFWEVRRY